MKSMWTGSVGFGMVQIPVKMYTATESHDVGFHWHHGPKCLGRVGYGPKVCKECQRTVAEDDILSGTEVDGKVVIIPDDDKVALQDEQGQQIEIVQFVDPAEIDPIMFEGGYYLGTVDGEKALALLTRTMVGSGLVAEARIMMRSKMRPAVLRVVDGVIYLHTLRWPDEIRAPEVPGLGGDFSAAELKAATKLVESMVGKFDPNELVDTYQVRLKELVAAKAGGARFVAKPAVELDATEVDDMLARLEASIARHPAGKKKVPTKAPAKKAPAKTPVKRRKAVA